MNKIRKAVYRKLYEYRLVSAATIGKKIGAKIGNKCRVLDDPFNVFGTEPYLVSIGNHVELTHGVRLVTHDGSVWVLRELYSECRKIDRFGKIVIGDNVFLGVGTIVLPGVTIGNNVIVGAGSVVTKDIADNKVYAGVPARPINNIEEFRKKVIGSGVDESKEMSNKEKERYIREKHPEWFKEGD